MLKVRPIARLSRIQDCNNQARTTNIPPDPAGRLDVFRGGFGLTHDNHEAKSRHVEANLKVANHPVTPPEEWKQLFVK